MNTNYKYTVRACYLGYIVQGIINNVNPILFIVYRNQLGISLDKIGLLIAANFGIQILVDLLASRYVDRIGYRISMVAAHVLSVIGLVSLGILPFVFDNAFIGLMIATIMNGIGGGLLEVLVSPIVEAAPSEQKDKAMSMLHSFYCWGCIGFIAISTIILQIMGSGKWYLIPMLWAILPFINILLFLIVPINKLVEEENRIPVKSLLKSKKVWIFILLMICAGAAEMGMSQWASYFAETGLNIDKTLGDIFGACFFCAMMGVSRLFYGKSGMKINLKKFMAISCSLCVIGYLMAAFSPIAILGLIGCGICGLSVGIMWPGTFSYAAKGCKEGGTVMFAILALAGDIGCITGPEVVNIFSNAFPKYGLKAGLIAAIIFPIIMLIALRNTKNL